HIDATEHVDFLGLAALEDLASLLTEPGMNGERLTARLEEIAGGRDLSSAIGEGFGEALSGEHAPSAPAAVAAVAAPVAAATPVAPAAPPRVATPPIAAPLAPQPPTITAAASSSSLLDQTISTLESFADTPMLEPTPLPEEELVPIANLLYRGRSAIERAIELRDQLRQPGSANDQTALDELFDLLELARAE